MFLVSLFLAVTVAAPGIPVTEARDLQLKGQAVLIDVRGSVPYEMSHIEGAVWMPLGLVRERGLELPQDKLIIPYCTCKREETSLEAAAALKQLGFQRVAVLIGGMGAWTEAGFPVVKADPVDENVAASPIGRMAPPAGVTCDRNNLTVYSGVVTGYKRTRRQTKLTIRTDSDTTERVVIRHDKAKDPGRYFMIMGTPLTAAADWTRFEQKRGKLKPGMRARVWVCRGGATFVDWRPAETGGPGL